MTYDFKQWLNVQPDDKAYNFMDCTGKCAMGQYMASRGEKWDMEVYADHVAREFPSVLEGQALSQSGTFGELKRKLETV